MPTPAEAITYCPLKSALCDATPCLGLHSEPPCQPELLRVAKQVTAEYEGHKSPVRSDQADTAYDPEHALAAVQRISETYGLPDDLVKGRVVNLVRLYSRDPEFSL